MGTSTVNVFTEDTAAKCATCGEPATCLGSYESNDNWAYSCNTHCGHGCEDGQCMALDRVPAFVENLVEWNDRYSDRAHRAFKEVATLKALLAECKPRLNRPPMRGMLTHEAQVASEQDYAERIARIDAALGQGAKDER